MQPYLLRITETTPQATHHYEAEFSDFELALAAYQPVIAEHPYSDYDGAVTYALIKRDHGADKIIHSETVNT